MEIYGLTLLFSNKWSYDTVKFDFFKYAAGLRFLVNRCKFLSALSALKFSYKLYLEL